MAKTYKRRRYYRRKGHWSANIKNIDETQSITTLGAFGNSVDLCLNPIQNSLTVSQQYTVKNVELSAFIESDNNGIIENLEHYIMYVPQGMNLTTDYNYEHPEYIMAYYYQGNPALDGETPGYRLKLKTRMARRLQTGDRIIYFYKGKKEGSSVTATNISVRGLVRWWTKAN